ncbi:hypothetical protein RF55_20509 [Lasius niger]|uniref:Uncharacterized protein n=1 Tax=Lasius niger TaxID=67767 RepID=A0A0J7JZE2_LASNI|nr:hypothetical protein RF55_20509 [Lasius niger]
MKGNAVTNYPQCTTSKTLGFSLHLIHKGLSGHPVDSDAVSVYNLLDEASLNEIAENAASRVWNGFVTFGSATAGVFGFLVIVRIIKLLVDTAIHGYTLHTAYG